MGGRSPNDDALLDWGIDPWPRASDDDDEYEDATYYADREYDRDPVPDFGCACQDPIVVDSVCHGCMFEMARQNAEADRERAVASERELRRLSPAPRDGGG